MLKPYEYNKQFAYDSGWDKYALSYSKLLRPDTIYSLTKDLAHDIVKHYIPEGKNKKVLDLNCGTGNDFPFFLSEGYKIVGTDGSGGMLNKACESYQKAYKKGNIRLYQSMMEDLGKATFKENQFDLIYSITGGYSYIDDDSFLKVNQILSNYLKKGGYLITAHLTPFCLGEFLYRIKSRQFGASLLRLKKTLTVPIKGERYRMYLRSNRKLKKLRTKELEFCSAHPILTTTAPYQTGYAPNVKKLKRRREVEFGRLFKPVYNTIADQILIVEQKK
ncbi:class I SAM-dependent DNA methyltransferase [Aureispira anguillae]|uniref:Class I SAM-dependent methyltransferase n=1 Tax=Aureispira anguillae TaxID=2864201 RepID=A0A915YGN4_9BACT|nr:class I SAM-dependent methyltransferase [Aureispira anguillae]BDS12815.1 class I SAM-dependent methyltransferase [Aureispira anguillae]